MAPQILPVSPPRRAPLSRRALLRGGALALLAAASGSALSACAPAMQGQPTTPGGQGPVTTGPDSGGVVVAAAGQDLVGRGNRTTPADPATAQSRLTDFAARLYQAALPGTGNALISPYSVMAALGMTYLGASEPAAGAYQAAFGVGATELAAQISAVDAAVAQAIENSKAFFENPGDANVFSPANTLFVQPGQRMLTSYLDAVQQGYGATLHTTDFRADPERARQQINAWVSERTHELIPDLLAPGVVNQDWRVALVNALYLKALWANEFGRTSGALQFRPGSGAPVQVDALELAPEDLDSASGDGWTSVSLPYKGGGLAMTVILPDEGRFDAVSGGLGAALLKEATSGTRRPVKVTMPPFTTDTPTDLGEPLKAMGLEPAFGASYRAMSDGPDPLFVGAVIHQARIAVDEYGTVAAAATLVGMATSAAPDPDEPLEFRVDRPFLYVIHDTSTNVPLFVGRIDDPSA